MSQEIELKLSVPEGQTTLLEQLPFWNNYTSTNSIRFHLKNTYFDTPDLHLKKSHISLRIREKQGAFYQTLKTSGASKNGLTRRGEWEWPLGKYELDFSLLESLDLAPLKAIQFNKLIPLFKTDFQRICWNLAWIEPLAHIEAALDIGEVQAQGKKHPICELELELLEGDEAALMVVAKHLKQMINLTPCDKSKSSRGFELLRESLIESPKPSK
ncbi:MAG: CYTH domain-containing protein [Candidatus Endonucleobacter bathymodioli]|uniref:CYTH domain-containing protein n=1 Tax=Candidatus Endonucleibacter bathymodioli TaxID=539814 RepID=A0AA90NPP1_9GAMM|nr:CYTH domain-containing protein [Candidatus Endonucleobacter bathymodioli]